MVLQCITPLSLSLCVCVCIGSPPASCPAQARTRPSVLAASSSVLPRRSLATPKSHQSEATWRSVQSVLLDDGHRNDETTWYISQRTACLHMLHVSTHLHVCITYDATWYHLTRWDVIWHNLVWSGMTEHDVMVLNAMFDVHACVYVRNEMNLNVMHCNMTYYSTMQYKST